MSIRVGNDEYDDNGDYIIWCKGLHAFLADLIYKLQRRHFELNGQHHHGSLMPNVENSNLVYKVFKMS